METQASEQDIRSLEDRRFRAMVDADLASLEALLADDLTYTHSNTAADTRARLIDGIRSQRLNYRSAERFDELIRLYGDSAVVTGRASLGLLTATGPRTLNVRYIDVWIKGPRGWQMVAWQSTPIPA